jgi:hypothetical protein
MSTLDNLIREASKRYNVSSDFLSNILNLERVYLYLIIDTKQSVRDKIRKLVQEEVGRCASEKLR